ncbi:MAG: hypothetical protein WCW78_01160 [Candidatus Paceibacterota bacterium]|jgi:hypothetical protein
MKRFFGRLQEKYAPIFKTLLHEAFWIFIIAIVFLIVFLEIPGMNVLLAIAFGVILGFSLVVGPIAFPLGFLAWYCFCLFIYIFLVRKKLIPRLPYHKHY